MQYRLTVTAEGEDLIIDRLITAEEVIAMLRPTKAEPNPEKEEDVVVNRPKHVNGKKVRYCGKCGGAGHRADACGQKKK